MAGILVLLIILGCVAYQYLMGTFVKSFAMLISALCAGTVAFAYFEPLANVLISRNTLVLWAQSLCFMLLFVVAFAVFQTIVERLTSRSVDLGPVADRIGRVVCGIFSGLVISGLLLAALAVAPLSNKFPYQRFDPADPKADSPDKALLNVDGFATGLFNILSGGSLSGKRSFAALHPDFLDQAFLNRHKISAGVPVAAASAAIELPKQRSVWSAPEELKDSAGTPLPQKSGRNLKIVRVGLKKAALDDSGEFTLSQLRLICQRQDKADKPLKGKGINLYPIGYLKTADQVQTEKLSDTIKIEAADFAGAVLWMDFVFYVPNDFVPVLLEFKQNNIAQTPAPVPYEQALPPEPFIPVAECARDAADIEPVSSARVYGVELCAGAKLLSALTLKIGDPNEWQDAQTAGSISPAIFKDDNIIYVRAELKTGEAELPKAESKPADTGKKKKFRPGRAPKKTSISFEPLEGYNLLSLKCNNPSVGTAIRAEQLPVLVELSGVLHHPVGVIASSLTEERGVYEVDYCSLTAEQTPDGLRIADDGSVAEPFPHTVWLTAQAEEISEFYLLYMVKSDRKVFIVSVRPGDSQTAAGFKGYQAFLTK
jgi:hypothetical protein